MVIPVSISIVIRVIKRILDAHKVLLIFIEFVSVSQVAPGTEIDPGIIEAGPHSAKAARLWDHPNQTELKGSRPWEVLGVSS